MHTLLFILLVAALFSYPYSPSLTLDASWMMALGQFFHDGLQFGPDVVFTYGPLGFLLANTYTGLHYWSLIVWQTFSAGVCAIVVMHNAQLLTGIRRIMYFGFFLFVGSLSPDVLHAMIIAMIGFVLLRRSGADWLLPMCLLVLFLALLASTKFTHLILASVTVLILCVQELWQGRWPLALLLSACFLAGYLALWMVCGQNLSHLPLYLHNSWQISQGYQQAMGLSTPGRPFWLGITVLLALSAYGFLYLLRRYGQSCTLSRFVLLAAFIYLVWKHGFVRSDGHMLFFFVSALVPIVAFPVLLDDPPHQRWTSQLLLGLAGVLCVAGMHSVGWRDIMWHAPSRLQDKFSRHYTLLRHWASLQASYEQQLANEKQRLNMRQTRQVIGQSSIDVLGYEQAIALYNGFTYRPRPVFQSYSAYTPQLARLNDTFYRSSRAPEYVLLKLQTIDSRFPTLDDSLLLRSFMHHYTYVHTERGFQLWQRRSQAFRDNSPLPRSLRSETIQPNQRIDLDELKSKPLWVTLQFRPSWLGRLRNTVYKLPIVHLTIEDTQGQRSTFRLTLPQAETGFILNPLIADSADYLCFAMGTAHRQVAAFLLQIAEKDQKFFQETAHVELSELPMISSNQDCHELYMRVYFSMFRSYPIHYETPSAPQEIQINGRPAVMLHAPSTMVFAVPEGTTTVSGAFGFAEGAYTGSGHTDGATFRILWQESQEQVELFQRRLDPLNVLADRGLQGFHIGLQGLLGGKLVLQIDPGTNSNWDWTAWTAIHIE